MFCLLFEKFIWLNFSYLSPILATGESDHESYRRGEINLVCQITSQAHLTGWSTIPASLSLCSEICLLPQ